MKDYKIEILETTTDKYIIDVKANSEEEAKEKADGVWQDLCTLGINHFHIQGHPERETVVGTIYDVTGTDDAPQEENCKKCGIPETMYWCDICERNSEEDLCDDCGQGLLAKDEHYHDTCNGVKPI